LGRSAGRDKTGRCYFSDTVIRVARNKSNRRRALNREPPL
jgi:hypothetical protein